MGETSAIIGCYKGSAKIEKDNESSINPTSISLVVLGVIILLGGAIATWQLYSSLAELSYVCLIAEAVGIALIILGIRKAKNKEKFERMDEPKSMQKLPWEKINIITHGTFKNAGTNIPMTVELFKIEDKIKGYAGDKLIKWGNTIVFFERGEEKILLPDEREPTQIDVDHFTLIITYRDGERTTYNLSQIVVPSPLRGFTLVQATERS